jgi:hypothetical protein
MSCHNDRLRDIHAVVVPGGHVDGQFIDCKTGKVTRTIRFPANYKAYLVNEGDHDLANVEMHTRGFEGSGEMLVELNRLTRSLGPLKRGQALLLEELDYEMLDFVLWYHLDLYFADGVQLKTSFSIEKAYSLRQERYRPCPTLGSEGYCFDLASDHSNVETRQGAEALLG